MSEVAYGNPSWMEKKSFFNINTPEFLDHINKLEARLESTEKELSELKKTLGNLLNAKKNKGDKECIKS